MNGRSRSVFIALIALVLLVVVGAVGCSAEEPAQTPDQPAETPTESTPPADDPAAGLRLAPGLYDIGEGKSQAIGTLEYRDLEGGFWVVTTGSLQGAEDEVVAVLVDKDNQFGRQFEEMKGKPVNVIGRALDGASIRMAGPELAVESIEEMSDTPGIAE